MAKSAKKDEGIVAAVIQPANMLLMKVRIRSLPGSVYVQAAFSGRTRNELLDKMSKTTAEQKPKRVRTPRDYNAEFLAAQHRAVEGWNGLPCSAFRNAMIDACRTINLVMTKAKMSIFVVADGIDAVEGVGLVRLHGADPERSEMPVRNDTGVIDIRVRPMWREWYADVTIEFDGDMITAESVVNLLDRAGRQVGIGEGRPFSKNSAGMGWGRFTVEPTTNTEVAA